MRSLSNKIFCRVIACGMIVSLLTALPPLGVLATLAHYQDLSPNTQDSEGFDKFDVPEMSLGTARCLPKKSEQEDFSSLDCPGMFYVLTTTKSSLSAETKLKTEFYRYRSDNDLDFNLPRFSYRQAPSEHASEG